MAGDTECDGPTDWIFSNLSNYTSIHEPAGYDETHHNYGQSGETKYEATVEYTKTTYATVVGSTSTETHGEVKFKKIFSAGVSAKWGIDLQWSLKTDHTVRSTWSGAVQPGKSVRVIYGHMRARLTGDLYWLDSNCKRQGYSRVTVEAPVTKGWKTFDVPHARNPQSSDFVGEPIDGDQQFVLNSELVGENGEAEMVATSGTALLGTTQYYLKEVLQAADGQQVDVYGVLPKPMVKVPPPDDLTARVYGVLPGVA